MSQPTLYVPILKGKLGEFQALDDLDASVRGSLMPCMEVLPPSEYDATGKTVDDSISLFLSRLEAQWGPGRGVFLDGYYVEDATMQDGSEPMATVLAGCREMGVSAIPVTGLRRFDEYQDVVREAASQDMRGVCLRLTLDDLSDDEDTESEIDELLHRLGVSSADVDLLLDCGAVTESSRKALQLAMATQLNELPHLQDWRSLTLAASAFPVDLSGLDRSSMSLLPRADWSLWSNLRSGKKQPKRVPTFGDYAVASPQLVEVDPRIMRMSPNIRYAGADVWFVAKGVAVPRKRDTKKNPPSREQYPVLAQAVVNSEYWQGREFSWGDEFIEECAQGTGGTGNATTWRRVGTGHHLTTVVRQIASLPAP